MSAMLEARRAEIKKLEEEVEKLQPERRQLAVQTFVLSVIYSALGLTALILAQPSLPLLILTTIAGGLAIIWFMRLNRISDKIRINLMAAGMLELAINTALHFTLQDYIEAQTAKESKK